MGQRQAARPHQAGRLHPRRPHRHHGGAAVLVLRHTQRRDNRRMVGQDLELSHRTRHQDALNYSVVFYLLGRNYLQLQHNFNSSLLILNYALAASRSLLAFSFASSMVPTFRNACSGRSSTSPSRMALKPLMVSSMGTMTPGRPVN